MRRFSHLRCFCSLEMDFLRWVILQQRYRIVPGRAHYQIINQIFSAVPSQQKI